MLAQHANGRTAGCGRALSDIVRLAVQSDGAVERAAVDRNAIKLLMAALAVVLGRCTAVSSNVV